MRAARNITEEENARFVPVNGFPNATRLKRDSVEPEPVGTIVLIPFRIEGYTKDCDGSLMAQLAQINKNDRTSGWTENCVGIDSDSCLVVTLEELKTVFEDGH